MQPKSIDDVKAKIPELLKQVPYLKLLVLFGSRARGDNQESSDWDFAMLFDEDLRQKHESSDGCNSYQSWTILQDLLDLGDDEIDWVDLKHASELLANAIGRDGVVIYARDPDLFDTFRQQVLLDKQQLKAIRHQQNIELEAALVQLGV